jgi:cell wall-associated NlpC family hydrolase
MRFYLWIIAALLLGACSGSGSVRPERDYGRPSAQSARSNDVLIRAIGLVGTPYRYGGNTPAGGFDCSGLVDFVFLDAAGLRLPRSTHELIDLDAPSVKRKHLRPGDLLFFNPGGGPTSHIGIYVGDGRFVHAPSSGGMVRLEVLDSDYWRRFYTGAKRVLH